MAARLFRSERQFKLPEDRQLDPHLDRNCHHTHHIAPPWSVVNVSRFNDWSGSGEVDGVFNIQNRKVIICHPIN
jgi:hypothetical protein